MHVTFDILKFEMPQRKRKSLWSHAIWYAYNTQLNILCTITSFFNVRRKALISLMAGLHNCEAFTFLSASTPPHQPEMTEEVAKHFNRVA